ncbi:MAG: ROK family protein [Opitutales bacterium]
MSAEQYLGLDIGGSGVKAAIVDIASGTLVSDRERRETPDGGEPTAMLVDVGDLLRHFDWSGPVGCGFPGVIQHGKIQTAANLSKAWIGRNLNDDLRRLGVLDAVVLNDADAAGYGELHHMPEAEQQGCHLFLTVGTGLGSALLYDGRLVANTELGHLLVQPKHAKKPLEAEDYISKVARKAAKLDWDDWAARCSEVLTIFHGWFWPESFVLGGGVTKRWDKFADGIKAPVPVLPARLGNEAGIIGAAQFAAATLNA